MKLTRKGADKKLLKAIADYVRARDNYTCYTCGKQSTDPRKMNAGHLFSRRHKAIRYDLRNIHCQCVYCNKYLGGNLHEYIRRLKAEHGEKVYEELYAIKDKPVEYTVEDMIQMIEEIKQKTKKD